MKPAKIFQQYIWIVNTLRQYKKLSLEQLNELWVKDEVIGGEALNRKSFLRHKDAILNMFGVVIECDLEHGYKYFIGCYQRSPLIQFFLIAFLLGTASFWRTCLLEKNTYRQSYWPSKQTDELPLLTSDSDVRAMRRRYRLTP